MPIISATIAAAFTEITDATANTSTSDLMAAGDSFTGTLATAGDTDSVAITLTAGQAYSFSLDGSGVSPILDTYLRLESITESTIAFDGDSGPGFNSSLTFTATTSGTYYIEADNFNSAYQGGYAMTVSAAADLPVFTHDEIADQLTEGFWDWYWGSTGSFAFNVSPGGSLSVDIDGLTTAGQTLAISALEAWTNVTGINFTFVSSGADISFDDESAGAFAGPDWISGNTIISSSVNISTAWLDTYGTTLDSYSFQTYIHEIGHAMGLGHAGNYNGSATYGVDNHYANDSWQATVMSYFSQTENSSITASYAINVTPMIADILAMQTLYGVATDQRTGDTTYGENSTAGGYYDQLSGLGGAITFTIFDNGGIDTIDFRSDTANQTVDLGPETISSIGGLIGNMSIARDTWIENFRAGSGDDTVTGNSVANRIWGGNGDDIISGLGGDDKLVGNGGEDTLTGGAGNDKLKGKSSADILAGGTGNDILVGGSGGDTFIFNEGDDRDKINDFANGSDTLILDETLWGGGLTVTQMINAYAVIQANDNVMFDFGGGDKIILKDFGLIGTLADLVDDISFA